SNQCRPVGIWARDPREIGLYGGANISTWIPVLSKRVGKVCGYVIKEGSDPLHAILDIPQSGLAFSEPGFCKSKVEQCDIVARVLRKLFPQSLARLRIAPREVLGLAHIGQDSQAQGCAIYRVGIVLRRLLKIGEGGWIVARIQRLFARFVLARGLEGTASTRREQSTQRESYQVYRFHNYLLLLAPSK